MNKLTLPPSLPVLECCGDKGGLERLLGIINIYHSIPNRHNPPVHTQRVGGCLGSSFPLEIPSFGVLTRGPTPPRHPQTPVGGHGMGHSAGSWGRWRFWDGAALVPCTPSTPKAPRGVGCPLQQLSPAGTHSRGADPAGIVPILRRFGGTVGPDPRLQPFVCGRGINYFVLSLPWTKNPFQSGINFGA